MGRGGKGWRRASATSYEITFTCGHERCRERVNIQPSPANDKRVERFRHAVLDSIERGTFNYAVTFPGSKNAARFIDQPGQIITVKDYLDKWLKRIEPHLKASTYNDYRKTINNHLIPKFGELHLTELKRPVIRDWCSTLQAGNKRIANMLSPLRVALHDAVDEELIETNPLYGWTFQRRETPRQDHIDPFSREEQAYIFAALSGQGLNLVQFALWTGMRTSELVALEWNDIDWHRGVVIVTRAITQAAKEAEGTKTRAGTREVKLLKPAEEALRAQREHTQLHPSGRVFLNPRNNEPWEGDQAIRKTLWTHALKRAKVRYRNPYQTRHTYASMMLSAGEPPRWVADQMGHTDLTMIFRRYGRWMPDANPDAGAAAVEIFSEHVSDEKGHSA